MAHSLTGWGTSIVGLFLVAGCATQEISDQDRMGAAISLGVPKDAQMMSSCVGEPGTGGAISYSEKSDVYVLSLFKDNKISVIPTRNSPGELDRQFARLNDHCFPKP